MKTLVKTLKVVGWLAVLLLMIFGQGIIPNSVWGWLFGLFVYWWVTDWLTKALEKIRATSEQLTSMAEQMAAIAFNVNQINMRGAETPLQRMWDEQARESEAKKFGIRPQS